MSKNKKIRKNKFVFKITKQDKGDIEKALHEIISKSIFLHKQGKNKEALVLTQLWLTKFPNNLTLLKNAGSFASMIGKFYLAEKYIIQSLKLNSSDAGLYNNLGILFKKQKRFDKAEQCYKDALNINPNDAEVCNNLGNLFKEKQQFDKAEQCYKDALNINPNFVSAYYNLGVFYRERRQFDKAKQCYKGVLKINPGHIDAQNNLSLLLLTLGDFSNGWRAFESRYNPNKKDRNSIPPNTGAPQYQGENLTEKTLLIYPEQGYGDEIQFIRYLPLFKKEKNIKKIILVCKPALKKLFSNIDCIDYLITEEEFVQSSIDNIDYWMFIMSLALYSGTSINTIPSQIPYLNSPNIDKQYWKSKLPDYGFKIGLVWKGNFKHKNDKNRSLPSLKILKPLWEINKNFIFVSLQKESKTTDFSYDQPLINLGDQIKDFSDTAAIISQLDLVICVDTAVAHLAGSLGKRCWVLLPKHDTDWRWLLNRNDSPWYPKVMRLFRQTTYNNWDEVVVKIVKSLQKYIIS